MEKKLVQLENVSYIVLEDDGQFPNNSRCPLLVYAGEIEFQSDDPAASVEELFDRNQWPSAWRNGVFDFHHYHSTAHEVLGVYSGGAKVQLGGEKGIICDIQKGDAIVIPAGVSHKKLSATADFRLVGAYPSGQSPDMCYGTKEERPRVDRNIGHVSKPKTDPVFGISGPLLDLWIDEESNGGGSR